MRIDSAKKLAAEKLGSSHEAVFLLSACLSVDRSTLWGYPERVLSEVERNRFFAWLEKREQGYPLAYLVGKKSFWTFELTVTEDTLIPRPETELLVEQALQSIPVDEEVAVLDLGTGSGAIAIAIALERPKCQVVATDISEKALLVAKENAKRLGITNIEFIISTSNWFACVNKKFDCIVSNPPYVESDFEGLVNLRYEPEQALVSGADGLNDIKKIIHSAPTYLKPGGSLLLEYGCDQGDAVEALLIEAGFDEVKTLNDLAGLARVAWACLAGPEQGPFRVD